MAGGLSVFQPGGGHLIHAVKEDLPCLSMSRVLVLVFSGISDLCSLDLAPGRENMQPGAGSACDFPHFDSPRQQRIRYQRAMIAIEENERIDRKSVV